MRCGVHVRVTEKRARRRLDQPPVGVPVDQRGAAEVRRPSTVASHPALLLCPSTSQNGVPFRAPLTASSIFVLPLLVTFTLGVAAGGAAGCVTERRQLTPRAERHRRAAGIGSEHQSVDVDTGRRPLGGPHHVVPALETGRSVLLAHRAQLRRSIGCPAAAAAVVPVSRTPTG